MTVPLILDVDTGIDDALALLYACGSPDADLVAVTCLSGNAALAGHRAEHAGGAGARRAP